MRRKHKIVVTLTFNAPVSEKDARRFVDAALDGMPLDDVRGVGITTIKPAQNFERVLAKEISKK